MWFVVKIFKIISKTGMEVIKGVALGELGHAKTDVKQIKILIAVFGWVALPNFGRDALEKAMVIGPHQRGGIDEDVIFVSAGLGQSGLNEQEPVQIIAEQHCALARQ